jgi:hypothetical protein
MSRMLKKEKYDAKVRTTRQQRRLPCPRRCALGLTRPAPAARPQLCSYLDKYTKAIVVHADNVGSNQFMMIRKVRRPAPVAALGAACGPAVRPRSLAQGLGR